MFTILTKSNSNNNILIFYILIWEYTKQKIQSEPEIMFPKPWTQEQNKTNIKKKKKLKQNQQKKTKQELRTKTTMQYVILTLFFLMCAGFIINLVNSKPMKDRYKRLKP